MFGFLRWAYERHRITHFIQVIERRGTPTEEVWKDVSALPNFLEFTPHPKVRGVVKGKITGCFLILCACPV